jgi:hypothetical protein
MMHQGLCLVLLLLRLCKYCVTTTCVQYTLLLLLFLLPLPLLAILRYTCGAIRQHSSFDTPLDTCMHVSLQVVSVICFFLCIDKRRSDIAY